MSFIANTSQFTDRKFEAQSHNVIQSKADTFHTDTS